jgi:LPS sulfotransferase NodH
LNSLSTKKNLQARFPREAVNAADYLKITNEVFAISLVKVGSLLHLLGDSGTASEAVTEAVRILTILRKFDANKQQWADWLKKATELLNRISHH